jgi:hypothetical protein
LSAAIVATFVFVLYVFHNPHDGIPAWFDGLVVMVLLVMALPYAFLGGLNRGATNIAQARVVRVGAVLLAAVAVVLVCFTVLVSDPFVMFWSLVYIPVFQTVPYVIIWALFFRRRDRNT